MRAQEFLAENKQATAQQVLAYINQTHHEPMTEKLTAAVQAHPQWELRPVPLQNLNIPDQDYEDPEQEPESDPYDRVMAVDPDHASEYSTQVIDQHPIVVDDQGYIIDGNHRAWAAAELMNRDRIQAWVPVKQDMAENFADGKVKGKSRPGRVKRSGASCNGSVTDLRARAKRASGEKAKMYHWCANMKSGKKNESEMDEGWKQNVAAGVLGAGMALGGGTAQADIDVFNKKLTPAEIQQIQTKADLTQRYYNELVRRAKEDSRTMDRRTLNMLKAQAEDAAARSVQQQPQAPQAKSTLPGTQPSEIRRSSNYKNFESVKK